MTGLLFLLLTPAADAADPAPAATAPGMQEIAAYRHGMMDIAKYHMKGSAAIVKGEVDRKDDLMMHAIGLQAVASVNSQLYPKGSGPDAVKTDALASVWERAADFEKANEAFATATAAYVEAVKTGDMAKIGPAFQGVGKSCGGCHDDFRKDED